MFLLVVIYFVKGNIRLAAKARNILYVAAVMSLGPLVLGVRYFSVVGGFITLTLIGELLLLHCAVKQARE